MTRQSLAAPQIQGESRKRHARRRAAQKERASLTWSCSNPARDDRATSMPSHCSTASPVLASLRHRSRMRTPRERLPAPLEKLAWPNASFDYLRRPGSSSQASACSLTDSRPAHSGCMVSHSYTKPQPFPTEDRLFWADCRPLGNYAGSAPRAAT